MSLLLGFRVKHSAVRYRLELYVDAPARERAPRAKLRSQFRQFEGCLPFCCGRTRHPALSPLRWTRFSIRRCPVCQSITRTSNIVTFLIRLLRFHYSHISLLKCSPASMEQQTWDSDRRSRFKTIPQLLLLLLLVEVRRLCLSSRGPKARLKLSSQRLEDAPDPPALTPAELILNVIPTVQLITMIKAPFNKTNSHGKIPKFQLPDMNCIQTVSFMFL